MPNDFLMPVFSCFGFFFFVVLTVLVVVLWFKVGELRDHVMNLEGRLSSLAKDFLQRPRPAAVPAAAPPAIPLEPARPVTPHVTPPAIPADGTIPLAAHRQVQPPVMPVVPAGGTVTSGKLLERLEDVRQKQQRAQPVHPAQPVAAAHSIQVPFVAHAAPAVVPPSLPPHAGVAKAAPVAHAGAPMPPIAPRPPAPPQVPAPRPAPTPPKSLEYYMVRGAVIVGSVAVAVAAILFVKDRIEKGYFGPLQRDWTGAIVAAVLVAVGQWRRRYEGFWSQGMTAGGIVAMFASIFAATTVHHFLTPLTGFIFLAVMTAVTVAMSLQDWSGEGGGEGGKGRGGMLIAMLGLMGGFITPILVNTGHDNVPGLFGYLILLHIGLVASTRIRGWSVLAALSVVLASLWLIFWTLFKWVPGANGTDGPILGLFMLSTVASLVISTVSQPQKWGGKSGLAAMVLTWLAVGLGLLSSCLLLGRSSFDDLQWAFFAALVAGAFVLARLRPIYEGMAWLASLTVLVMLTVWGVTSQGLLGLNVEVDAAQALTHLRLQGWMMGFGIATVLAAFACQWKSAVPMRWALLANLMAVAYVAAAYWILPGVPRPDAWALVPVIAAVSLVGLAMPVLIHRNKIVTGEQALTFYGHGILALLLMAPPMAWHDGALTAAWAALLPVTALAIWRLRMPGLLIGFVWAVFLVSVRALMLASMFDAGGEGRNLFWNPVVWCYGSIFLGMGLSAWILEYADDLPERLRGVIPNPRAMAGMLQVGATVAAFMLLTLEVRWYFHDGKLNEHTALLVERGTFAIGWLLMAAAVTWIGRQIEREIVVKCGEIIAIVGVIYAVMGLVVVTNPLWWHGGIEDVGSMRVLNLLVFVYGVPAAICGLLAWVIRRADPENSESATMVGVAGIILMFMMVTLQVRQGFVGPHLGLNFDRLDISFVESSTYGVAWLALGALCLGVGRRLEKNLVLKGGMALLVAGVVQSIVIVGVAMNPVFHNTWVGDWPVINVLLFAYGAPIVLTGLAGWVATSRLVKVFGPEIDGHLITGGVTRIGELMTASAMVLTFLLVTMEIRQGFSARHMGLLAAQTMATFTEIATYGSAWLMLGAACLAIGLKKRNGIIHTAGGLFAAGGVGFACLMTGFLMNPLFHAEAVGDWPILNALLYAYGLPLVLAGVAAWVVDARAAAIFGPTFSDRSEVSGQGLGKFMRFGMAVLLFILATTQVRQAYQGTFLNHDDMSFIERGTYSVVWLAIAGLLLPLAAYFRSDIARRAGLTFLGIAMGFVLMICTVLMNPLWTHESVGAVKVFNGLLLTYGIPAAASALLAWWMWDRGLTERTMAWFCSLSSLLLTFVLVTLEVQHLFRGDHLALGAGPYGEYTAYDVAWLVLGLIYLVVGVVRTNAILRWASLVLMLLTIIKVFIFDMAELHDLERVMSFAGLGFALMGLAFFYQRFVFRKPAAAVEP